MRLDNIKNFRGYSYITKEEFGVNESNASLLKNLFVDSKINPEYIDATATTVSVTANSGITGNGSASNALALDFSVIGEGLTKVGKSGTGTIAITGTGLTYNGAALNAANGLVKLDANAKLAASQLPDLAITQVYTKAVTSSNSTVLTEIKAAITEAGVQRGDVVILTATDKAIADAFAGSYIFTADVAAKADITTDDYVKMYAPAGTVTSVNNVAPVAGNVTVGWGNIGDGTVTSFTVSSDTISINSVAIASKAYAEQVAAASESNAKSYADDVAATAESNAKTYTDTQIGDLVTANSAIGITELKDITWGTKDANGIATASVTGYVVAVLDENGMQCFPQITYSGTTATISANWGANTPASGFKAVVVKSSVALTGLA